MLHVTAKHVTSSCLLTRFFEHFPNSSKLCFLHFQFVLRRILIVPLAFELEYHLHHSQVLKKSSKGLTTSSSFEVLSKCLPFQFFTTKTNGLRDRMLMCIKILNCMIVEQFYFILQMSFFNEQVSIVNFLHFQENQCNDSPSLEPDSADSAARNLEAFLGKEAIQTVMHYATPSWISSLNKLAF